MFTLYGVLAALSMAALFAVTFLMLRRQGADYGAFVRFTVLCIPLTFLCSRIAFCLSNLSYYCETIAMPEMMLHVTDGGASMTGALVGVMLAAVLAAKWSRIPTGVMLDAAAFGMPAALVIERLAEPLCEMGWGKQFQSSAFDFMADWTQGMHPVFAYEAIAAVIIGLGMLRYAQRRRVGKGDALGCFLLLYGVAQTVLESLRDDGHMKVIHFVRVNQVAAITLTVAVLIAWSVRCWQGGAKRGTLWCWLTTAVCIGFGIIQEFAADGDENPYFSYTVVAAVLSAVLIAVSLMWFRQWRQQGLSAVTVPGAAVLAALLVIVERAVDTGSQRLFFVYGVMALNLFIIVRMAFALRRWTPEEEC